MIIIYNCKTGEKVETYIEYLNTNHWKAMKVRMKNHYVYECCFCRTRKRLHIHHKTYERVGNERLSDLVYACKDCHDLLHSEPEKLIKSSKYWNQKPRLRGKPNKKRKNKPFVKGMKKHKVKKLM